jgi:Flp pilus assembly protein TadG
MGKLKKIAAGTAGSEIAEAALVLPILFMLLLGIYWFGRAFNVYATINHAAREGARAGTALTCATCANTQLSADQVATQVKQAMQASHLDPSQAAFPASIPVRTACVGGAPVACSAVSGAGNPQICVRFNVLLQPPASLPAGSGTPACGVSVEFQYPYQFSFPFTSLNMQTIILHAGVQMTGEY